MIVKESYQPSLRAVPEVQNPSPGVAIWAPDGSGTIELARLAGPTCGLVMAPAHLLGMIRDTPAWNLDDDQVKIRLYELCLTAGGPFDVYRYVNLAELLRLWAALDLPANITETWERAFVQAGLESLLPQGTGDARTRPNCLAG